MTESEIVGLEAFAASIPQVICNRSHLLNAKITPADQRNILCVCLGIYATDSENFKFKMGEKVLINQIIRLGKEIVESHNNSYDIFEVETSISEADNNVVTLIGEFFGNTNWKLNPDQPFENGTFLNLKISHNI